MRAWSSHVLPPASGHLTLAAAAAADSRPGSVGRLTGASTDGEASRPACTRLARRAVCVAMLAASAGSLTFSASDAGAATPLTDYSTNLTRVEAPIPQEGAGWARRLRTVPDLNGDGRNEILVAAYPESFGGFSVAGRVYMQDGATRRVLYMIDSPQIQSNVEFGFFPAVLGDVNGDGKADFVAGARGQDTLANGTPALRRPRARSGPATRIRARHGSSAAPTARRSTSSTTRIPRVLETSVSPGAQGT